MNLYKLIRAVNCFLLHYQDLKAEAHLEDSSFPLKLEMVSELLLIAPTARLFTCHQPEDQTLLYKKESTEVTFSKLFQKFVYEEHLS